jgi:hypothetical protein
VLPIASNPDSVIAAVSTNVSMIDVWRKTLARRHANRSASRSSSEN